jgi:4-hydroxybenzoate polyprenyltransferase
MTPTAAHAYWITLRPYLFFVSGVSGALGLALAGARGPAFAAAFAAFFFSYGLGQAVTDVFQTDTDSISSPYRPLTQGLIGARQVLGVSLAGLCCCGVTLALLNPWNAALSAAAAGGLIAYTPCKRRWWAGPWWNAWIVALLPAMGILCGGPVPTVVAGAAMASVFSSYAVFVLLGYLKDVTADRLTGYETLPVKAGFRVTVLVSAGFLAGAAGASGVLLRGLGLAGAAVAVGGILAMGGAHVLAWNAGSEREAHRAIAWSLRGFVLLHLGETVAARPELWAAAALFYAAFELALARRPERTQI